MKTGIIFDVDGTLWDSSPQVGESWSEVFSRHDDITEECGPDAIMRVMGKPMTEIARIFFPELPEEKQLSYLKECEEYELEYLRVHPPVAFEGVKEVFERLSERYPLFVVSNCQSGYVELMLELCGLEEYVTDTECFGNNGKDKSENIRLIAERNHLTTYYYVGDIEADYRATVLAGGAFIHAAYGFGEVAADVPRIHAIRELPELMEKLGEENGGDYEKQESRRE